MGALDAILFDLDDTLLGNDMNVFLRGYFPLLADYVRPVIDPDRFLPELMYATQAVINSDDPSLSNRDVFWRVFCERNDLDRGEVEPFFATFYEERFGELQSTTQRRPEAEALVRWCFDQGLHVVIATNPLFPRRAVEQRMAWAGIPVDQFDFDLVTVYENMHSAKPHAAYYHEILAAVDVEPQRALMVGDDWENDIVPTSRMGMHAFWIAAPNDVAPDSEVEPDGRGQLGDLFRSLQSGWLAG
jgi:HAD superfamily hydrolase (TIGR01549 family)